MKKRQAKIDWQEAPDIKRKVRRLAKELELGWIKTSRIFTYRSTSSKTRAYARTWGLPGLWQRSLNVDPAYIIEVISEHFDNLSGRDQDKIIIHELTHIPHNFSGALVPHIRHGKRNFHKKVDDLINRYFENKDTL